MFDKIMDRLENILKIGSFKNIKGSNGKLQEIQIKTLRNLEDAFKVGQFGFNSKAPVDSRGIVARLGNENIVIANEHLASIIDITTGNTVIYNQTGHTIKIEGDTITTDAPNIVSNCTNFTVNSANTTINATTKFKVVSPVSEFSKIVNVLDLLSAQSYSGLSGSSMTTNVNLETSADVKAGTISLKNHTHGGVQSGTESTGAPQ